MTAANNQSSSVFTYRCATNANVGIINSGWQFWHFECNDWPGTTANRSPAFWNDAWELMPKDATFESPAKYMSDYIKKGQLFESPATVLEAFDELQSESKQQEQQCRVNNNKNEKKPLLPSQMAPMIFFNRKVGIALFRAGVPPNYEHPLNVAGSHFQMLLFARSADVELLRKFDKFFCVVLGIVMESDLPSFNGIFLRCELNPGKQLGPKFPDVYRDHRNLPCLFKMELWFSDTSERALVETEINEQIVEQAEQIIGRSNKSGNKSNFGKFTYSGRSLSGRNQIKRYWAKKQQQN